ncbi:hypothetical protein MAAFP003_3524 [Mycobacterium ahvazicum]|uniref:Uncharacterized protein n=1 Tax=Mycobacterium ahvazicum TaxID=1964395 RepID=A0A2K4YDG6_9MYCO|nr:hypothetical protein MAAFP003_3524 [Mycobacterium ahvazicum]
MITILAARFSLAAIFAVADHRSAFLGTRLLWVG